MVNLYEKVVKSAKVWEVESPPPINSRIGRFVPSSVAAIAWNNKRRISVEIHGVSENNRNGRGTIWNRKFRRLSLSSSGGFGEGESGKELRDDERCIVRLFDSTHEATAFANPVGVVAKGVSFGMKAGQKFIKNNNKRRAGTIRGGSKSGSKFFRGRRSSSETASSLASSISGAAFGDADVDDSISISSIQIGDLVSGDGEVMWMERYALPVSCVTSHELLENICVVTLCPGQDKWIHEIIFDSDIEAAGFARLINHQKKLEKRRARIQLQSLLDEHSLRPDDTIKILVEIVSAWGLHGGDDISWAIVGFSENNTPDPYVAVRMNGHEVHRTKCRPNTTQPIWTVITGSLFVINTTVSDLFLNNTGGIIFEVRDSDALSQDDSLGAAILSPKELFNMNGERTEINLTSVGCRQAHSAKWARGTIALRCRRATMEDETHLQNVLRQYKSRECTEKIGLITEGTKNRQDTGHNVVSGIIRRNSRHAETEVDGEVFKEKYYRVRPRPALGRDSSQYTEWMTSNQIESLVTKDSCHWIEAGSGRLGEIYLEILGADGLSNLDVGLENKTDAFVSIVYGDAVVQTDVVSDCLKPRWLPWTQRAFLFHIVDPTAPIFIAIFDYDGASVASVSVGDHDRIGQITVGIQNFAPSTDYVLHYDMYKEDIFYSNRKTTGSISIRLRIEWADEQKALLASLRLFPAVHVNVEKAKTLKTTQYTCDRECDRTSYSLTTLASYIDELYEYLELVYYVEDALYCVLLWRGNFDVAIPLPRFPYRDERQNNLKVFKYFNCTLPLHSMFAFASLATVVECPEYLPSFCFACVAWVLLAVMHYRLSTPSPFMDSYSFQSYFLCLLGFRTKTPPKDISADTNKRECIKRERKWMGRISKSLQELQEKYDRDIKQYKEEKQLLGEFDYDITTKLVSAKAVLDVVDPLKPWIFPWQQYLAILLRFLRFIRSIITWETSKQSFWITLGSIAFSFVCLFIPWKLVWLWTARTIVWVFFSPFMKLVDIYYVQKLESLSEEEKQKLSDKSISLKRDQTKEEVSRRRKKREDAFRLRDFKRAQFGKFLIRIPRFTFARYLDIPKVSSSATPHCEKKSSLTELALKESGKNRTIVQGQSLIDSLASGDMILRTKPVPLTIAPTGMAVRELKYLQTDSLYVCNDSRFKALLKICLILSMAAGFTYMFVPFLRWSVNCFISCAIAIWRPVYNAKSWPEVLSSLKLQMLYLRNNIISSLLVRKDSAFAQAIDFVEEKKHLIAEEVEHVKEAKLELMSEFMATTSESIGAAKMHVNSFCGLSADRFTDRFLHLLRNISSGIAYWANYVATMARDLPALSDILQTLSSLNYREFLREMLLLFEEAPNRFLVILMDGESFLRKWTQGFSKDCSCYKKQVVADFVNYVYQFIK